MFGFQVTFANDTGKYDLEVTTFQMAVLFAWNERPRDDISYDGLRVATELPDAELRKTLWVRKCDNINQYRLYLILILILIYQFVYFPVFGVFS